MHFLLALFLSLPAAAEMPLPSYKEELATAAWVEVNTLVEVGRYDEAIARADKYQKNVAADAGLEYLIGFSYRMKSEFEPAELHLRKAVEMDPTRKDAWSDLGEILLAAERYDEAREAFVKVDELLTRGRYAWIGPFRLGELAAHQHRPEEFEEHIREALRRGFSFRTIEQDPNWKKFYADPTMRNSLEKLITVYGDVKILDSLRAEPGSTQGAG